MARPPRPVLVPLVGVARDCDHCGGPATWTTVLGDAEHRGTLRLYLCSACRAGFGLVIPERRRLLLGTALREAAHRRLRGMSPVPTVAASQAEDLAALLLAAQAIDPENIEDDQLIVNVVEEFLPGYLPEGER